MLTTGKIFEEKHISFNMTQLHAKIGYLLILYTTTIKVVPYNITARSVMDGKSLNTIH